MSGGSLSLREWWGAGTGCPERLWIPHPWRCSRPSWIGPLTVCPCILIFNVVIGNLACSRKLELDDPRSTFQPKPFCNSMTLSKQVMCSGLQIFLLNVLEFLLKKKKKNSWHQGEISMFGEIRSYKHFSSFIGELLH